MVDFITMISLYIDRGRQFMKKTEKECIKSDKFLYFLKKNNKLLNQPIMKGFLKDKKNYSLLAESVCDQCPLLNQRLDESFRQFYFKVKSLKYFSSLIYYYAIDLDKKYKLNQQRYSLILDKPIKQDGDQSNTLQDYFNFSNPDMSELIITGEDELFEHIGDINIYTAIKSLTDKQKKILELKYIYDFKNKDIAKIFNDSPQNISKIHKNAIEKIRSLTKKLEEKKL